MSDETPANAAVRLPATRCPTCGAGTEARYRPFCSKRCADVDLARWMTGAYRVPTNEVPGASETDDGEY